LISNYTPVLRITHRSRKTGAHVIEAIVTRSGGREEPLVQRSLYAQAIQIRWLSGGDEFHFRKLFVVLKIVREGKRISIPVYRNGSDLEQTPGPYFQFAPWIGIGTKNLPGGVLETRMKDIGYRFNVRETNTLQVQEDAVKRIAA
jgi:hypothetical protein